MHNLHVKFESDQTKTAVYIVPTRFYTQSTKGDLDLWSKINRVPLLIMNKPHVKFEIHQSKTVACMDPTRLYTQSTKVDIDLWPRDPKLIGLLFSSTTYMWSLKAISLEMWSVSCPQGKARRTDGLTHPPNHRRTVALLYPLQRC